MEVSEPIRNQGEHYCPWTLHKLVYELHAPNNVKSVMNMVQDGGANTDMAVRTDDDRGAQSSYISVYEALDSGEEKNRIMCTAAITTPAVCA